MPENNKHPQKIIKKRKLSFKKILILLLVVYLLGCCVYYLINLPIKNIYITGTSIVKDVEIIELANIKDYPALFKINNKKMINSLKGHSLIKNVSIKKNVFGKLSIEIEENKVLFFNRSSKTLVLSGEKEIDFTNEYLGVPILINYVPNQIYEIFINKLQLITSENLQLISEIEYSPSKSNDIVIDDTRFLFRMNDENEVYININNIEAFNGYIEMYTTFGDKKGTLYLDTIVGNYYFQPFSEEEIPNEKL